MSNTAREHQKIQPKVDGNLYRDKKYASANDVSIKTLREEMKAGVPELEQISTAEIPEHEKRDKLKTLNLKNKTNQRLKFGNMFVGIYIGWLVFTGAVLLATVLLPDGHRLSDTVLIALLTTTLGHVISIIYVFAKYLYPEKEEGI